MKINRLRRESASQPPACWRASTCWHARQTRIDIALSRHDNPRPYQGCPSAHSRANAPGSRFFLRCATAAELADDSRLSFSFPARGCDMPYLGPAMRRSSLPAWPATALAAALVLLGATFSGARHARALPRPVTSPPTATAGREFSAATARGRWASGGRRNRSLLLREMLPRLNAGNEALTAGARRRAGLLTRRPELGRTRNRAGSAEEEIEEDKPSLWERCFGGGGRGHRTGELAISATPWDRDMADAALTASAFSAADSFPAIRSRTASKGPIAIWSAFGWLGRRRFLGRGRPLWLFGMACKTRTQSTVAKTYGVPAGFRFLVLPVRRHPVAAVLHGGLRVCRP